VLENFDVLIGINMLMDYDAVIRVRDNVLESNGYQISMTKAPSAIIDTVILVAVGRYHKGNWSK